MTTAYYYTPVELGMDQFPDTGLRLPGFAEVPPDEADVFVVTPILRNLLTKPRRQVITLPRDLLMELPYFDERTEPRHVLWNVAEDPVWFDSTAVFLRCDATQTIKAHDPNTHGFPWPVMDLYRPLPERFDFDVVFQGWGSTPLTQIAVDSVRRVFPEDRVHLQTNNFFYGYHDGDPEFASYRTTFLDTLGAARLSLVPDSIPGIPRYRFYEALSMGRVPVLIGDGHVLPFEDVIDYDTICLRISAGQADQTGEIILDWLNKKSSGQLETMCLRARDRWERYMNREHWMDLAAAIVLKHLEDLEGGNR